MNRNTYIYIITIVVLIFLIYGLYVLINNNRNGSKDVVSDNGIDPGSVVVEPVVNTDLEITPPSLEPPVFGLKESSQEQLAMDLERVRLNQYDSDAWMNIGLFWNAAGENSRAEEVWLYVLAIEPGNGVVALNLANLYAYDLRDIAKAEEYYNKAQEISPFYIPIYFQGVEFYRYVMKDITQAKKFLGKGLDVLPNDTELLSLRSTLNQ